MSTTTRAVAGLDSGQNESERAPAPEIKSSTNDIANLAYSLWQQRGSPEGSPEQDWLEAEKLVGTDKRK